jgi:hypothetical protein
MKSLPMAGLLATLLCCATSSWAQSSNAGEQETISQLVEQIKQLQQHDRELEDRIKLLEGRQQATVTPPQELPAAQEPSQPIPIPEPHELHGIQWRGVGELEYNVLDQHTADVGTYGVLSDSAASFYTENFDLLLTARISEKSGVLSELVFEQGDNQLFEVNLERLLLKDDYNDHLRMSFGRYHTNVGYYNTAFHSGSWLQTAASRPLIMQFADDGGLLPTQAIGVSVTGTVPSGKLGLNYLAEYGASDTVRPSLNGTNVEDDLNNGNHLNLGFFVRPDAFPGLQVGASYYHDRIHPDLTRVPTSQTIINGHVVYNGHGIEFLNEGFLIRHAVLQSSLVFDTPAFYTQFARRLGPWRPFFRYQYINARPGNAIYQDVGLRYGPSVGARYDLNEYIGFKAQLDHTSRRAEPDLNGAELQLAFTF